MITQNHVAKVTRETIIRLGWETLAHPQYSPDIASSDYHLFHSLDNHLRGRQFRTLDVVKTVLDGLFASCSKEFYHVGVHGLPSRWQKVLDSDGDYFRRSSIVTVTIFDATAIIFISMWRFEVSSLIPTELFWLPLYVLDLGLIRILSCV
jgi:hypothetical protein